MKAGAGWLKAIADPTAAGSGMWNYLLNRDIGGAANDNSPVFLAKVG